MTPSLNTPRQGQSQTRSQSISSSSSTDKTAPVPSSSSSISRLNSIVHHISPKMVSTTNFPAEIVPQAPEDPLFGLAREYKADDSPNKIDLVSSTLHTQSFNCAFVMIVVADFDSHRVSAHTEMRTQSPGCCQSSRRYETCASPSYTLLLHDIVLSQQTHSYVAYTNIALPDPAMSPMWIRLTSGPSIIATFPSWDRLFVMRHLDPSHANMRHNLPQLPRRHDSSQTFTSWSSS
jgi:hypothetical protein